MPATAANLIITIPRTWCIYLLPKIHKPNKPGRPIVSAYSNCCPTELISSYLDKIMALIVKCLPSYVKDSQQALKIFRDFYFLDEDKLHHHQGGTESRKTLDQKFIFQIGTLNPQRTLFTQLIYTVVFHVIKHQPIA